jgi:hypothetical protein
MLLHPAVSNPLRFIVEFTVRGSNRSLSLYVCTHTVQMHIPGAVVTVELVGSNLDFGPKASSGNQ